MAQWEASPFVKLMGIKIIKRSPERSEAELHIRDDLCNRRGVIHGGALMGWADTMGGMTASAALTEGQRTATIESKTNFFAPIKVSAQAGRRTRPREMGRSGAPAWSDTPGPRRRCKHRSAPRPRRQLSKLFRSSACIVPLQTPHPHQCISFFSRPCRHRVTASPAALYSPTSS